MEPIEGMTAESRRLRAMAEEARERLDDARARSARQREFHAFIRACWAWDRRQPWTYWAAKWLRMMWRRIR